ncbi:unnamed protein product, partial [Rotaria sp. Silwood2]
VSDQLLCRLLLNKSYLYFNIFILVKTLSLSELIYFIDLSLTKCNQLSDQLDASSTSSCSNEYSRSLIISLLKHYASYHPKDWHKYEYWNGSETYIKNLIAHHSNRFTLMLVCWKGCSSPIHNHAGSDC